MNWVPATVTHDALKEYASIEQVRAALNFRDIYIPSYFPQTIAWPPSKILAQGSPFPALVMEFKRAGGDEIILVLSQSRGGALKTGETLVFTAVSESAPIDIHGNKAILNVGVCVGGMPCSALSWNEGGETLNIILGSAPFDLTKIAASMHP